MIPYYYKLFVWIIVTWSYNCSLRIIIIIYLKPYYCVQTNDYYLVGIITWNHITVYKWIVINKNIWYHITVCKLFVSGRNTWNHTTVCKLFVSDRNTWYLITVCKKSHKNELHKNHKYKRTMNMISKALGIK